MPNSVLAVKPETLLVDLPPIPSWFERELSQVATRNGKPVFKIVDGQRELKFRNEKMDVKHLLQHQNIPAFVPVVTQTFRRKNEATGEYKFYSSLAAARADTEESLSKDIDVANKVSTRAVGKACWIIEVYVAPEELGYDNWQASRYANLEKHGVARKVDVLGEFPREGMYVYCFSVLDSDGRAISPNQKTLDECKRRWRIVSNDTSTLEQNIKDYEEAEAKFAEKEVKRIADNVYQFAGISARRWHHGEVSKSISKVYE